MQIAYVYTGDAHDRVYVTRDDGTEHQWSPKSWGRALPHDLVHYVVEASFGVKLGFWGLVAEGVDFTRLNAAADAFGDAVRPPGGAAAPLAPGSVQPIAGDHRRTKVMKVKDMEGRDTTDLVHAECLANSWGGIAKAIGSTPEQSLDGYRSMCRTMDAEPRPYTEDDSRRAATALDRMTTRWQSLGLRVAIDLEWPPGPRWDEASA